MLFTKGHEKIYFSYFVYGHYMYRSVTIIFYDINFEILNFSGAYAWRHKHCKPECSFRQTRVDYFLQRKYDVISQLRHSYAKDPLCVTRLK